MSGNLSTYLANLLGEVLYRNTTFSRPANIYVGLHSGYPGLTGLNELSGGGYARIPIPTGASAEWNAFSGGASANTNAEEFAPASAAWSEVVAVSLWDAATVGNMWKANWLSNTRFLFTATNTGDVFTSYWHTLLNNDRLLLQGTNLPAGPSANTLYNIVNVSGATFQISLTQGGAAVTLTGDGTGEVLLVRPKSIGINDIFRFPAGDLDILFS